MIFSLTLLAETNCQKVSITLADHSTLPEASVLL